MPRANGLEAASEILMISPRAKIIMLTGEYNVLKEAKRIGIQLFLTKPVSIQQLVESVEALSNESSFDLGEEAPLISLS
jgi:YesN/AraC family two-component response regulator